MREAYVVKGINRGKTCDCKRYAPLNDYIEKHGRHFTEKLLGYALDCMVNRDGSNHRWSVEDVRNALSDMSIPNNVNLEDITYAANMAYADFYGSSIKSEEDCLLYAIDLVGDVDGYDGIVFNRYVADLMIKNENFDFKQYI